MDAADRAVLDSIGEILTPDLVDDVIARVRELLGPERQDDSRDRVGRELAGAESEVANLTDAIAMGGDMPALVARLQKAEQRRQELAGPSRRSAMGRSSRASIGAWSSARPAASCRTGAGC